MSYAWPAKTTSPRPTSVRCPTPAAATRPPRRTGGAPRNLRVADVLRRPRETPSPQPAPSGRHHPCGRYEAPPPAVPCRNLFEALQEGNAGRVRGVIQGAYRAGLPMETLAD